MNMISIGVYIERTKSHKRLDGLSHSYSCENG